MQPWTIYIGSDHRGFEKKQALVGLIANCHGFLTVEDLGPLALDPDDDFNDAAIAVARAVRQGGDHALGILICGSAHGVTMQANRFKGIRAINASTPESAQVGREHDHANVLCLSADTLDLEAMDQIIKAFCHAHPSTEARYTHRVARLDTEDTSI